MKVSELARRAGIAASALRFYEAEGLLPPARRTATGYRDYDDADLCRVRLIVSLRSLGLDLRAASRLARQCGDGHCDDMVDDLQPLLGAKRQEIAAARADLDRLDARLAALEEALRSGEPSVDRDGGLCGTSDCCEAAGAAAG